MLFQADQKRKFIDLLMTALLGLCCLLVLTPLFMVLIHVVIKGSTYFTFRFFVDHVSHAFYGTMTLLCIACLIGIPWGMFIGLYLSEYAQKDPHSLFHRLIRISTDLLASIPSILVGLFVYTAVVLPMKSFSALAGGIALGILMVPSLARSVEEILKLVPISMREGGLALGLSRWKVTLEIVLTGNIRPITKGIMLSVGRVMGETAPLLFTALNNRFWSQDIFQPTPSLPIQVYTFATSPYENSEEYAWSGALLLIVLIFSIHFFTRFLLKSNPRNS